MAGWQLYSRSARSFFWQVPDMPLFSPDPRVLVFPSPSPLHLRLPAQSTQSVFLGVLKTLNTYLVLSKLLLLLLLLLH